MANHVIGVFDDPQAALAAAARIRDAGLGQPQLISPIPVHGADEVLGPKKSVIRRFTLFGGIFGALFGFTMAAGTAVLYLHPTGGRPIITFPPFLIITYEMTILCGILATVLGFFISARFPALRERVYVPEAAVDKFVVTVECDGDASQRAEALLGETGAGDVRRWSEEGA